MKQYNSIYAPYLVQFVNYKRSLGYRFNNEEYTCLMFDKFVIQELEKVVGISKSLAEKWSKKRPNESDRTRYMRMSLLGQFSDFLNDLGYRSYTVRLPRVKQTYLPYIFSDKEIKSFFTACDATKNRCVQFDTSITIIPTFFRLLYATGIRLSEALSIKNKDVNFSSAHLIVKATKNGRDRLIPLSESLLEVCMEYNQYKKKRMGQGHPDEYFFTTHAGTPCPRRSIYNWFRKILGECSISHGGKGKGPRVHDFRHTFSVRALRKMTEDGMDLYYSLPILSTYLGHQSIKATEQYVRLTTDIYPDLLKATNGLTSYVFPK